MVTLELLLVVLQSVSLLKLGLLRGADGNSGIAFGFFVTVLIKSDHHSGNGLIW